MTGIVRMAEARHFYDGENRLRVVQRQDDTHDGASFSAAGVWEEYRYDPLGRRVMVRTRRESGLCFGTAATCVSSITRFVWAGDQLLWELKAPGTEYDNLEATTGAGERFGRVSYTHGGGIDRPLALHKEGQGSLIPHDNWRDEFASGTCIAVNGVGCGTVAWPGWQTNAYHAMTSPPTSENWRGGLVDGMRDATGQMYKRNRYYDPSTGQFTQPDPIGIAGGLNVYGFAAGDPVSYSDPYGLSACIVIRGKKYCYGYFGTTGVFGINRKEARFLWRNPIHSYRAESIARSTLQEVANLAATGEIPGGTEGLHNGPADAVRHAVWSCRMTQSLGESTAEAIGDNHEASANQPESEKQMDRHNNRVGRDLGRVPNRNCMQGAINALTSDVPGGSLQTEPE